MPKMRVHEVAKLLDKSSKEIITKLKEQGVEVQSHMSTVSDENVEKLKLLFYLKTGEFKCIKFFLNEFDVRYIENSKHLLDNKELTCILSNWEFLKAEVLVSDEVSVMIKS